MSRGSETSDQRLSDRVQIKKPSRHGRAAVAEAPSSRLLGIAPKTGNRLLRSNARADGADHRLRRASILTTNPGQVSPIGTRDHVNLLRGSASRIAHRSIDLDDPPVTPASFEIETRIDDVSRLREIFGQPSIDLESDGVVWLSGDVSVGPSVSFGGECRITGPIVIERGSVLTDVRLGAGTRVRPYSVLRDFAGGARNLLGPFCFLRDGCITGDDVILGAHVETARSRFGSGTRISHRAFVGDAEVGDAVIIGAGVVFCNYDGQSRQSSTIETGATIGSGSLIVAPVRVGEHAIVAAGSVVTKDILPHGKLLQRR